MTAPVAPDPAPFGARLSISALEPTLRGVVAIAGAESNAGKTHVCEVAIRALRAAGLKTFVLKTTRTHLAVCPRGIETCGTCDSLEGAFEVVRDPARIRVPGKDTSRYVEAGADHVRWLLARPDHMAAGVRAAIADPPPNAVLIAEGNSFLDWCDVDAALMALSPRGFFKPSATYVIDRIDAFTARPSGDGSRPKSPRKGVPVLSDEELGPFLLAKFAARDVAGDPRSGRRR